MLWLHRDAAATAETKQIKAAERCSILVLLANGLFEDVDLDVARLLGELAGGNVLATKGMKRIQQTHGK